MNHNLLAGATTLVSAVLALSLLLRHNDRRKPHRSVPQLVIYGLHVAVHVLYAAVHGLDHAYAAYKMAFREAMTKHEIKPDNEEMLGLAIPVRAAAPVAD